MFFRDEENEEGSASQMKNNDVIHLGGNPFLEVPSSINAVEYKKGYVMRKCCYEANAKRSEFLFFHTTFQFNLQIIFILSQFHQLIFLSGKTTNFVS